MTNGGSTGDAAITGAAAPPPSAFEEARPRYRALLAELGQVLAVARSVDEVLLRTGDLLLALLDAERATTFALDLRTQELYSMAKTGPEPTVIRVPKSFGSLAGAVALTRRTLVVRDAYDGAELARIHPELRFDARWDQAHGLRTRQVLTTPILAGTKLLGVLQFVNSKDGADFQRDDELLAEEIARLLGATFYRHVEAARAQRTRAPFSDLVAKGLVAEAMLEGLRARAKGSLAETARLLVAEAGVPKAEAVGSLAAAHGVAPFVWDGRATIPAALRARLSTSYLRSQVCAPVGARPDGTLVFALEDPSNLELSDGLRKRKLAPALELAVGLREDILGYVDASEAEAPDPSRAAPSFVPGSVAVPSRGPSARPAGATRPPASTAAPRADLQSLVAALRDVADATEDDDVRELDEAALAAEDEVELDIVRLVREIIVDAFARGASDVHLEPSGPRGDVRVRLRIDGDCTERLVIPGAHRKRLVQRLKIMADLDIAERRRPQDGKLRVKGPGGPIEVRIATLPTVNDREDVVLRILASFKAVPLEELAFTEPNLRAFRDMIKSPYGIVLVVGPTGSGKTTTLHSALAELNTPDTKILTAEDPVEIVQPGLRQVQIAPKIGLGFAELLRAFLRADPDVIMIGEMRDRVSADTAVEASLTGHFVLSTLQSNSATETLTRLIDMEIDAINFADALRGVLAQRLVKRLCDACKQPFTPTDAEWDALAAAYGREDFAALVPPGSPRPTLQRAVGCPRCIAGYRGRLAIHELLPGTPRIKSLVRRRATIDELRDAARAEAMRTLLQDGVVKVLWGLTDLAQVEAACVRS